MKTCGRCRTSKPLAEFSKCKSRKDGLQSRCKSCTSGAMKKYRLENEDAVRVRAAADYEKHADAYRQRAKISYEKNRDEIKIRSAEYQKRNKDKKSAWDAKYCAANKDKGCARTAQRKAAKLQATPAWADHSAIQAFYAEAKRATVETGEPHHVDHIVPLQSRTVCGLHCEINLRVIHEKENISKSNRYWPDMP